MRRYQNLTEAVRSHGAERPDHCALIQVGQDAAGWGGTTRRTSYGELDRDARRLAAWLQSRLELGERVLIQQQDQRLFAVSLLACLYSGMVAVPAPPPAGAGNAVRRALSLVRDSSVSVVLTDAWDVAQVSQKLAMGGYGYIDCAPVDTLLADDVAPPAEDWRMPALGPDSVALLQYTSGSTKAPRGVVIAHRHLLANLEEIRRTLDTGPDSVFGGWLPLHHDMGLVGQLLHPLSLGATTALMTPDAFARDPGRWLRMISEHRITVTGAPDSGYRLCADRARAGGRAQTALDLSGWQIGIVGGEPVRASTLRDFQDCFAGSGLRPGTLRPAYGLAEATLLVSCAEAGGAAVTLEADRGALEQGRLQPATGRQPGCELVSTGPVRGLDVRIVDPDTSLPAEPGRVGEIWLRGASVGGDYWHCPPDSTQVFHGRIDNRSAQYLRTGDLGLLHRDELYITGRRSELIIVAGRNLHPLDLERSVQELSSAFGPGAAFGVQPYDEPEQIVIVQEVRGERAGPTPGRSLEQLAAAVRERVAADFAVRAGGVVLVRPGTVRRTTSGKLERVAVRRLFLGGRITALYELVDPPVLALVRGRTPDPDLEADPAEELTSVEVLMRMSGPQREAALRGWLGKRLSSYVRRTMMGRETTLSEIGLDSIATLGLLGEIERQFRLPMPSGLAYDYPTVGELAAQVAGRIEAAYEQRAEAGVGLDSSAVPPYNERTLP
jgi:acyl-CoA synthetase (AMP-forming)/AMP-acid ligase II/acyl carrier protein